MVPTFTRRAIIAWAATALAVVSALGAGGPTPHGASAGGVHPDRAHLVTMVAAPAQAMSAAPGLTVSIAALNAGARVVAAHVPAGIVPLTVIDDLKVSAGAPIFRINKGYTAKQATAIFLDAKAPLHALDRAVTFVAGFSIIVPGQRLSGWIRLTPGSYVVASGGFSVQLHTQTFIVDPAPRASTGEPTSVATIEMRENAFAMPALLPAGTSTLKVVNTDADAHLAFVSRLAKAVTRQQLLRALALPDAKQPAWLHDAPPLGVAGILSHGQSMWWTLHLPPGHYAITCPLPGPDGKPHVLMGMFTLFDVR